MSLKPNLVPPGASIKSNLIPPGASLSPNGPHRNQPCQPQCTWHVPSIWCTSECDLHSAICILVIDHWSLTFSKWTHQHQWALLKQLFTWFRSSSCICVIDWSMTQIQYWMWFTLRNCICVIDWSMTRMHYWMWFTLRKDFQWFSIGISLKF